jgi:hypothetical protein
MSPIERSRIEAGAHALQLFTTGTTNAWRERYWMERSHAVLKASGYADELQGAVEDRATLAAWLRWHFDGRNDLPPVTFDAVEAVVNRLLPPKGR